jgi:hypothetical protein
LLVLQGRLVLQSQRSFRPAADDLFVRSNELKREQDFPPLDAVFVPAVFLPAGFAANFLVTVLK